MKTNRLLVAFGTVWSAAAAQPVVTVRVYNYAGVPESVVEKAKVEGGRLLQGAGIAVEWLDCPLREGQIGPRHQACLASAGAADMLLRIVPRPMEGKLNLGHSLGYSLPFVDRPATRAYVLYDRVREKVRQCGISESRLLGYVMAHEIAHLLFGDERHSRRGVMMAAWQEKEMLQIDRGMVAFSPDEARLLIAGAMARGMGPGLPNGR